MRIVGVRTEAFPDLLPHIAWAFDNFAERSGGEAAAQRLVEKVLEKDLQCWVAVDGETLKAVALTSIFDAGVRVIELRHCTGTDREAWSGSLMDELERWGRAIGAAKVRTINRPGHTRFLKRVGYRETHRVMEKELSDG
ncbi:MAG: hypothetical protein ACPGSI_17460 [Pikeienuella sp.]